MSSNEDVYFASKQAELEELFGRLTAEIVRARAAEPPPRVP